MHKAGSKTALSEGENVCLSRLIREEVGKGSKADEGCRIGEVNSIAASC